MIEANSLAEAALAEIREAPDLDALERIRLDYLGRGSGRLSALLEQIGSLPKEQRPAAGKAGNDAKNRIEVALGARAEELERRRLDDLAELEAIDVTFPAPPLKTGRLHVLTQVQRELEEILAGIGFAVEVGPEVETDWYNFEALNLPKGHASRDAQDTFFMNAAEDVVLRTHTSPVQIRAMERLQQPPIYVIVPGRVYRRDASDPSHNPTFMQLEGLAVDEGLTFERAHRHHVTPVPPSTPTRRRRQPWRRGTAARSGAATCRAERGRSRWATASSPVTIRSPRASRTARAPIPRS